ncbi:MAG: ATP-binding protein [Candidatus Obscuribacter sp.]|nr:ATP-binding protein [Candidatus Obscuribacter sp.]
MDAATKIYEGILADGEPGLQRMKLNREPESNLLDFKRAKDQSAPLRQDDRTHLAKSIGGFANSDGGVLVWGVDARVQNGIDGVCELYPIKKLKAFKSELENLTPKYVYPVPDGIIHTPIYPDENKDEGYILTLVPAYDGLPVRSTIKDQGSDFFVRAGDQFTAMSHSHLADPLVEDPNRNLV